MHCSVRPTALKKSTKTSPSALSSDNILSLNKAYASAMQLFRPKIVQFINIKQDILWLSYPTPTWSQLGTLEGSMIPGPKVSAPKQKNEKESVCWYAKASWAFCLKGRVAQKKKKNKPESDNANTKRLGNNDGRLLCLHNNFLKYWFHIQSFTDSLIA